MTTLEIGILSAIIGGTSGILSQIISKSIQNQTDIKKTIRYIISEERRLAYLIRQNSHSLYANDFDFEYYKRQLDISKENNEQVLKLYYEAHTNHDELFEKHSILIGEYLKNITEFTLLCDCPIELDILLEKIISEKYLNRIEIKENDSLEALKNEYEQKHPLLKDKAIDYTEMFNNVGDIILKIGKKHEIE